MPTLRPTLVLAAVLLATLAALPAASLTTRTFWDFGHDLDAGDGVGIYDPAQPAADCLATQGTDGGLLPSLYYANLRVFPGAGADRIVPPPAGDTPLAGTPLEDCLGSFLHPDQAVALDTTRITLGSAVALRAMTCSGCVAVPATAEVAIGYCRLPAASDTSTGVRGLAGVAFSSADVACGGLGVRAFPAGCLSFASAAGSLDLEQPIFLDAGPCNSLVGSPSASFIAEVCLKATVYDTVTGIIAVEDDVDHFVVLNDADTALLAWAADEENVSNLQGDYGAGGGVCA